MTASRWPGSLRQRLLAATVVTLALALTGAHWFLSGLFRDHVMRQLDISLTHQLDQVTAQLEFDVQGQPRIDARSLSDPRWDKPYSGLYWQLDLLSADGAGRSGVLRSRSLWDVQLTLAVDALANGGLHTHDGLGPQGNALRIVERSLEAESGTGRWRLLVAADTQGAVEAAQRFQGVLAASLTGLGLLLVLAAWTQVAVGLAPLKALQQALVQVRDGRSQRLEGRFPAEVQPLIDEFNTVLDRHAALIGRARTQAGNLAHALKTPLAVLDNAARGASPPDLRALLTEQVQVAQRHIQWHLARARAAAAQNFPGQRTPVAPLLRGLQRVMEKLHADRLLMLDLNNLDDLENLNDRNDLEATAPDLAFAGEAQDLQEMLGNLLDNACRCARSRVRVQVRRDGPWLNISVDDDGPGIAPAKRNAVLQRGVRLDESTPGSGLGLGIVVELAALYGGQLTLETSDLGGLSARLALPAAP